MYPYLFAFDFDKTIADTSQPPVDGIDIEGAYKRSVRNIFGLEGEALMTKIGGLKNRAPSEFIHQIFLIAPDIKILLRSAHEYYDVHREDLLAMMSSVKGFSLDTWDEAQPEQMISEIFVRRKLQLLLPQIGMVDVHGDVWPPPCKGFLEFWQYLGKLQKEGIVQTAIISSGHDSFIGKTFALYDLPLPDYMVTEDDIRGRQFPKELSRRVKPGQLQLAMVHRQWLSDLGYIGHTFDYRYALATREHIMYFGDDANKDGGMARGAQIPFGHFHHGASWIQDKGNNMIRFDDWSEMATFIDTHRDEFMAGRRPVDIFFSKIEGEQLDINQLRRGGVERF